MKTLWKWTVCAEFWDNCPKLPGNCVFSQNVYTRKLGQITIFNEVVEKCLELDEKNTKKIRLMFAIKWIQIQLQTLSKFYVNIKIKVLLGYPFLDTSNKSDIVKWQDTAFRVEQPLRTPWVKICKFWRLQVFCNIWKTLLMVSGING